ncbi:MAG: serine--tRNA ligase [Deltaproteobacteria bacterium]|nr:MAG: serine--tRNA ligase [Deltaproteobacteria bacterium]
MLDLKLVTERPELVRSRLELRGEVPDMQKLLELADRRRQLIRESQEIRHFKKQAGGRMKELVRTSPEQAGELQRQLKEKSQQQKQLEAELAEVERQIEHLLLFMPNLPHESVPAGSDESDNVVVREVGEIRRFDFEPKPHWDLGPELGILDFERGAKLAGSRFTVLAGAGARLERALINFMVDLHSGEHGYREVWVPFLVGRESMLGTGQLPKFEQDAFKTQDPEFFLVPTAEVPVTNLHRDEIIDGDLLPLKYVCYTPCFRREAGAHGKDTRGIIRQHQFDKVELVQLAKPEESYDVLERLTSHAERVLQLLQLPYRVVTLCGGDLGFSAAKTYDIEVWMPGQSRYREISSCSNFEDFQARRARIRFRRQKGTKPELVHTLNGCGLAVGRTLAAILENHQQPDGSVVIPEPLVPYTGFERIGPPGA